MRRTVMILLALAVCTSIPAMGQDIDLDAPQMKLGYAAGMPIGTFLEEMGDAVDFSAFVKGAEESYNRKDDDETELLLTEREANDVKAAYRKKMQAKSTGSPSDAAGLEISPEKLGYALGMEIAAYLEKRKASVDFVAFMRGVADKFHGKETLISDDEAVRVRRTHRHQSLAEKNLEEAKAFSAENYNKEDVITTRSGLQYTVLKEGDGEKPDRMDRVKVRYTGTLLSGKVFDTSTATFDVSGVIRGWTEALQLMSVGSTYKLFIPPHLAYGKGGSPPRIGPDELLIFEVELLEIVN